MDLDMLHLYKHIAWIMDKVVRVWIYCMGVDMLHGYGHVAWIGTHCLDVA
jgi:hypothetical protein